MRGMAQRVAGPSSTRMPLPLSLPGLADRREAAASGAAMHSAAGTSLVAGVPQILKGKAIPPTSHHTSAYYRGECKLTPQKSAMQKCKKKCKKMKKMKVAFFTPPAY